MTISKKFRQNFLNKSLNRTMNNNQNKTRITLTKKLIEFMRKWYEVTESCQNKINRIVDYYESKLEQYKKDVFQIKVEKRTLMQENEQLKQKNKELNQCQKNLEFNRKINKTLKEKNEKLEKDLKYWKTEATKVSELYFWTSVALLVLTVLYSLL